MKSKLSISYLLLGLLAFSLANTVQSSPHVTMSGVVQEDTVLWTFSVLADPELLSQEPFDEANGIVSAQFNIELPEGLLVPESVQVLEGFNNPVDPTLIEDPGLDPYSGETITGAATHFSVDAIVEVGTKDAIFLSVGSTPFQDDEPRPALSFSTLWAGPCSVFVYYEGILGQAGQSYYLPFTYEDYVCQEFPGDYNLDGVVGSGDLGLVLLNWGAPADPAPEGWLGSPPTHPVISSDDLGTVLLGWGPSASSTGSMSSLSVPEPASVLLALTLLAALPWARRFDSRP